MTIHAFGTRYTLSLTTRKVAYRRNRFGRMGADPVAAAGVLCALTSIAVALSALMVG